MREHDIKKGSGAFDAVWPSRTTEGETQNLPTSPYPHTNAFIEHCCSEMQQKPFLWHCLRSNAKSESDGTEKTEDARVCQQRQQS